MHLKEGLLKSELSNYFPDRIPANDSEVNDGHIHDKKRVKSPYGHQG